MSTVTLALQFLGDSGASVHFAATDGPAVGWVPRSMIGCDGTALSDARTRRRRGSAAVITVTIPVWKARELGFVGGEEAGQGSLPL